MIGRRSVTPGALLVWIAIQVAPVVAQSKPDQPNSLVLQAKQVSQTTGRPILAIAGSNT